MTAKNTETRKGKGGGTPFPFTHFGLLVGPMPTKVGETFYAEVEPAGSRWLPLRGRTARWWFEVHSVGSDSDGIVERTTHAYVKGGSGGAFTLGKCVRRAMEAVYDQAERSENG